ncbi:MAG: APC family permease [Gemmatimonadetes bacterium]|nr:APC family permease [Gemmatimonadota bacterium]
MSPEPGPTPKHATQPSLRRAVTRWEIVGLSLNDVIGSGVYLLPAAAAALLGPASLWAVLLAGFAVLMLVLCFAEAGSHFDEPGSAYVYTREAFGDFVGFEVGWMTWLARIASVASLTNGMAQALTFLWPATAAGLPRLLAITLPLALIVWVNVTGVQYGARLSVGLTIAKLLPLLFFIAIGIWAVDWSLVFPMPTPDTAGLAEAAALLLFAYAGFENTAAAAGEFKNPRKDVPFALMTMIVVVTLIYTLVQLVALGTLPDLASRQEGAPLADAATLLVGAWAGLIMTAGAAISIGGNVGSSLLNGPRYLYALAKDGYGPRLLARVHTRYQTPWLAIVTQGVLTAILALSGSFTQLAMLSIVARLATYIGTAAAVPVLRRKHGGRREDAFVLPGGPVIPILALLLCLAFLASANMGNLIAGAIGLAVGLAIYFTRRSPAVPGGAA